MKAPELEQLTKLDPTTSPETVAKTLNEDGAVVVENLVAPEILERIQREIDPHLPAAMRGKTKDEGIHTRRLSGLVVKSPTFAEFLLHPLLLGVCEQILLPNAAVYQLAMTQYIEIGPSETTQVPHRDDVIYGVPDPHPQFEYLFALALSDFTEENGATRIGKWAHQFAPDRVARPEEMVGATMSAGSVLLFLGTTYHGGGPNRTSDQLRRGVFGKYSLGWLRQEENQFLVAPPDVARKLSPELRGLLGYRVSPPQLGWVMEPEVRELFVEEEFASQSGDATMDELWQQIEEERAKT